MTQRTRQEAGEMAKWLIIGNGLTFMVGAENVSCLDVWANVLLDYAATGVMPAHCDSDEAAAEAWAWVMGQESPLDGHEPPTSGKWKGA